MPDSRNLAHMFAQTAAKYPDVVVQYSKDDKGTFQPTTYAEALEHIKLFAAGLKELGVDRGDKVGLIADNRREWLVSDFAVLGIGAADVPRGCDATDLEIAYILDWSECRVAILENEKQLRKVVERRSSIKGLATVILFDAPSQADRTAAEIAGLTVLTFAEVNELGAKRYESKPGEYLESVDKVKPEDPATIIYTSGTTGDPKGVPLTHRAMLNQAEYFPYYLGVKPGHIFLAVLPIWHSYERSVLYIIMEVGASIAYSKPVGSVMLADMATIKPQWLASVPRIWEAVKDGVYRNIKLSGGIKQMLFDFFVGVGETYAYFRNLLLGRIPAFVARPRILDILIAFVPFLIFLPLRGLGWLLVFRKIKAKLGGKFIAGISGGGALPPAVDRFFDAIGVLVLEGYGLTETAPILGVRKTKHPMVGTVGPVTKGMELRVVDEHGKPLPPGHKGHILARGPQVMAGYYKKPDLTAKVLSSDGWLDTGDLGMLSHGGELKLTGRAKDTIVLRGGENIEPTPIEQRLCESEYIQQCMVLGQDQKYLAALVVPKQDALSAWAEENGVVGEDYEDLLRQPEVQELLDGEIKDCVSQKTGFKPFERIFKFKLLAKPFEVGRELSAKQDLRRHAVNELYRDDIEELFAE